MSSKISLSKPQYDLLVEQTQTYCDEHHDLKLEQFDAAFMVDFFIEQVGKQAYNQALEDAKAHLTQHVDALCDRLYELEKY
jgi:uncharacterized protein (DUF2164 family)